MGRHERGGRSTWRTIGGLPNPFHFSLAVEVGEAFNIAHADQ
jgi:hypothetical protein